MSLESLANFFGYASLACFFSFWLWAILNSIPNGPKLALPGLWWLGIMGVGIACAGIAAIGRSKLWFLAMPLAIGMFLFVMYVIGS